MNKQETRLLDPNQLGPSRGDYVILKNGRKGIIVGFGLRDGNIHDFIVKIPGESRPGYIRYTRVTNYLGVVMIGEGKWKETLISTPNDINEFIKKTRKEFAKCSKFPSMSLVSKLYYKLQFALDLLEKDCN